MKKLQAFLFFAFLSFSAVVMGQKASKLDNDSSFSHTTSVAKKTFQTLSGRVVSCPTTFHPSVPMPGVTVLLVGTTVGTTTDSNGDYVLNLGTGHWLIDFSFIGYKTKRYDVGVGESVILNLCLEEDDPITVSAKKK